eukprot:15984_1
MIRHSRNSITSLEYSHSSIYITDTITIKWAMSDPGGVLQSYFYLYETTIRNLKDAYSILKRILVGILCDPGGVLSNYLILQVPLAMDFRETRDTGHSASSHKPISVAQRLLSRRGKDGEPRQRIHYHANSPSRAIQRLRTSDKGLGIVTGTVQREDHNGVYAYEMRRRICVTDPSDLSVKEVIISAPHHYVSKSADEGESICNRRQKKSDFRGAAK